MNSSNSDYFLNTYHQSRQRFFSWLEDIRDIWPNVRIESQQLPDSEDLTVDWIRTDSLEVPENMVLITAAIHGVEGYLGSAIQKVFVEEFLNRFDPQTTGVTLVHSINSWGMANKRRVNPNNVDLNRNFLQDDENFLHEFNPGYADLNSFLNPSRSILGLFRETLTFMGSVIKSLARSEIPSLRGSIMLGQRSFLKGLYFCGTEYQAETRLIMNIINSLFQGYQSMYQIDLHTGYGPKYQMSLISSPNETRSSAELEDLFKYPRVLRADPDQFYQMKGDMIDWVYQLQRNKYPESTFYGTAFEFGTNGTGILAEIASLRTTLFENQAYFHGTGSDRIGNQIKQDFLNHYYPSEKRWREKALDDSRQAFEGIFQAFQLI